MKLCITSEGNNLDSRVDLRFGRCQYFIIVDIASLDFEAIQNPNIEATGGAGIQSAEFLAEKQVKAVVTGNVGPNAFRTLIVAGIDIFICASGSVKEVLERYKKGALESAQAPNVNSKFGSK
ncbi:MAG: NifB/NifX family molybdenum-iron cluster-binding protein [bacterium]